MAKKSPAPAKSADAQRRLNQLDRLLKNLAANRDQIEGIVVSVALKRDAVYPNDGQKDAGAGGYTVAIDLDHGREDGQTDDDLCVQATSLTRGLAVNLNLKLCHPRGLFG